VSTRQVLFRLGADEGGATAIEFGILGSFMVALLLGVLQIGIAMQNYNALRGVSADIARHAVVEYQAGREMTNSEINGWGRQRATNPPYDLSGQGFTVNVTTAADQRVAGATELSVTVSSDIASVLSIIGFKSFNISHTRPIFVIDE
jgi:Flp pilus assembly protein TadG